VVEARTAAALAEMEGWIVLHPLTLHTFEPHHLGNHYWQKVLGETSI